MTTPAPALPPWMGGPAPHKKREAAWRDPLLLEARPLNVRRSCSKKARAFALRFVAPAAGLLAGTGAATAPVHALLSRK